MAAPQPHVPVGTERNLPPVSIDGHALFEFSLKMNRALKRLERRFGTRQKELIPFLRKTWKPLPKNPR